MHLALTGSCTVPHPFALSTYDTKSSSWTNNAHQILSQSTNHPTWPRTDESSHVPNRPWNHVPTKPISPPLTTSASFDQSDQTPWSIIQGSGRPSLPMIRSHTACLTNTKVDNQQFLMINIISDNMFQHTNIWSDILTQGSDPNMPSGAISTPSKPAPKIN